MNKDNKIKYGWICPVCGTVMSPEQATCVFCIPTKISSLPYINVDYTKTISVTESHYDGRLGDKEDKRLELWPGCIYY